MRDDYSKFYVDTDRVEDETWLVCAACSEAITSIDGGDDLGMYLTAVEGHDCERNPKPGPNNTVTVDTVRRALNAVVDTIEHRVVTDASMDSAMDLVVNGAMHYLEHPLDWDLDHAIETEYSEKPAVVLGWLED